MLESRPEETAVTQKMGIIFLRVILRAKQALSGQTMLHAVIFKD